MSSPPIGVYFQYYDEIPSRPALFIEPGNYSVGIEPEVAISNGTGAALNLKPRFGHTDLLDWEGLIGMGSGARNFRVGLTADLEWFPDVDSQPGIATAVFTEYYRVNGLGLFSFGVKPMIYKTFHNGDNEYTPFFAVPLGWNATNGSVDGFMQFALGSNFKLGGETNWRFTGEVGFNASNSYSYISGGVTYLR
ncbi:MAG: hypothetical protein HY074_05880 [Deltaproteobacteria bacterium]|nr:hypothetical protein [Deltaproteobacteria bacterium]